MPLRAIEANAEHNKASSTANKNANTPRDTKSSDAKVSDTLGSNAN